MRKLALEADPQQDWDPEEPYLSTYRLLFGSFPSPCQPNFGYDTHSKDKSISFFSGEKRGWFFLYEKLPSPTQERVKYTEDDIQAVAKEFSDFALTQTVKVKDVWSQMCGYGMTNLQEGILGHWTFGRVVLIGNSCHKFTTHIGLGFNNGVQDVVVLCNALRKAVHQSSSGIPGYLTLIKALQTYEESRKDPKISSLLSDLVNSGFETRLHTWKTTFHWMLSRYLFAPAFVEHMIFDKALSPEFQKGQILEYGEKEEPMNEIMPWLNAMES